MKEKICARISENHEYICENKGIARSGENECTQLELTLDECLCDYWVYIDFTKPDGTTYKTSRLDVVDNKVIYDLPNALLSQKGTLKVQVVLQKEDGEIWKSTIKHYTISTSINATNDIPNQDDFITEAQKLLNEVEEGLTPTIGENGNWFILDKDTGKTSRGEKGDKGDKGDAGSVKFIIANELPTEDIEEDAIYMIPSNDPQAENTYQEYIYVNGAWESLGSASVAVNMDDYPTKEEMNNAIPKYDEIIIQATKFPNIDLSDANIHDTLVKYIGEALKGRSYDMTSISSSTGMYIYDANFRLFVTPAFATGMLVKGYSSPPVTVNIYLGSYILEPSGESSTSPSIQKYRECFINPYFTVYISKEEIQNKKIENVYSKNDLSTKKNTQIKGTTAYVPLQMYQPLTVDNTKDYTPTSDYHPATKKYVDDKTVTLTQAEYDVLVGTGTVTTEDGKTYTYDENTYYNIVEG